MDRKEIGCTICKLAEVILSTTTTPVESPE